jgi:hypothetical protein
MLDPQHPEFQRIFVSKTIDHLAPAAERLNPEPICGKKASRIFWDEYPLGTTRPDPGTRLCVRCEALAATD